MYKPAPPEVLEARAPAIRWSREISDFVNKKWKNNAATMGGLISAMVLQNIIISIVAGMQEPGSSEGEAILRQFYDGVIRDAVERWHAEDLKVRRKRKEI